MFPWFHAKNCDARGSVISRHCTEHVFSNIWRTLKVQTNYSVLCLNMKKDKNWVSVNQTAQSRWVVTASLCHLVGHRLSICTRLCNLSNSLHRTCCLHFFSSAWSSPCHPSFSEMPLTPLQTAFWPKPGRSWNLRSGKPKLKFWVRLKLQSRTTVSVSLFQLQNKHKWELKCTALWNKSTRCLVWEHVHPTSRRVITVTKTENQKQKQLPTVWVESEVPTIDGPFQLLSLCKRKDPWPSTPSSNLIQRPPNVVMHWINRSTELSELWWFKFSLSVWGCPHWTTLIVGESRWTFTNIEENSDILQNNHQYDVTGPIRPQNGKSWTLKWL